MVRTLEQIKNEAQNAINELLTATPPKRGDIVVIGCSTSEVLGHQIGSYSSIEAAQMLFSAIYPIIKERGLFLAAQCCEHLNRAIIVEQECLEKYNLEQVNVVPQPKAGGSFATAAYKGMKAAVAVEQISANCGIDIGGTLIGMHLKKVAVPVRLDTKKIGEAAIICARTRPKFVGGERANYDEKLK